MDWKPIMGQTLFYTILFRVIINFMSLLFYR